MSKNVTDLIELISTYYPKLRKVFRDLVSIKDIPISLTQLTCLNVIHKQGKLTMSALAEELSMSNQQLTKVVDALVGFEMVEREYDSQNRRKIYAKITSKGTQLLADLQKELDKKLSRIMKEFSEDEMDKLYDCIAHIATYFGYKEENR